MHLLVMPLLGITGLKSISNTQYKNEIDRNKYFGMKKKKNMTQ